MVKSQSCIINKKKTLSFIFVYEYDTRQPSQRDDKPSVIQKLMISASLR